MNFREKIINAIYGQCVADAVGNNFEFKSNINPEDVIIYANESKSLIISDDSQMGPLFGFEAIRNMSVYDETIEEQVEKSFTDSYLDWYCTQTTTPLNYLAHKTGVLSFQSMYSVQAPGNTCLSALKALSYYGGIVKNDSMGCGSVMRLLPLLKFLGSPHNLPLEKVIELAKITGKITHKHKDNDPAIEKYIKNAYDIIHGNVPRDRVEGYQSHKISDLGEGWIAPECVDMAILAYTQAETFDELLQLSIAHDGDSDSVAAVAGSLWGLSGKEVPQKYIDKIDSLDAIKYVINNYIE
jgi:ADP-ribosylglycohydrolase